MAKGFKVIPKETPKKEDWDYEKIKQLPELIGVKYNITINP